MERCNICPRGCNVERGESIYDKKIGACKMGRLPVVARASVHMWEEPPISGTNGSGTVFFSGCSLNCVFCQNSRISSGGFGKEISVIRLREIYFELIEQGVHNINLVNPTHFTEAISQSLSAPLPVPVVYNSGGYDRVESLKQLEGKVQIYLPDLKYAEDDIAARFSGAADYFKTATAAIAEMYRQVGSFVLDDNGIMQRGVIIRHLVLPGHVNNTFKIIDWVAENFAPGEVMFSIMSQYTPCHRAAEFTEINRRITRREYERVQQHLFDSGFEDGFLQQRTSAVKDFIPDFELQGVDG